MTQSAVPEEIRQNLGAFRRAIEERKYSQVAALLAEQRRLFGELDLQDASARDILNEAQDLNHWAILLTQIQHSRSEQALASVLRIKQLGAGYTPAPASSAGLVNLRG